MSTEIIAAGAAVPAPQQLAPSTMIELAAIAADSLVARKQAVDDIVTRLFVQDVHYGPVVPGSDDMMLEKAGSELLAAAFQLGFTYEVQQIDMPFGDVRFISTCRVIQQATGQVLGSGMGEASTAETKFAWRKASDKEYEQTAEDRRRIKTYSKRDGGSWDQKQVRELTEDKANTALKMANKRAASDAIQAVLGVRGLILQGLDPKAWARGKQQAPAKAEPVWPDAVRGLIEYAAERGVKTEEMLAELKRGTGHAIKTLSAMTRDDYAYLMYQLGNLPRIDAATGEVVAQKEADPDQDGML